MRFINRIIAVLLAAFMFAAVCENTCVHAEDRVSINKTEISTQAGKKFSLKLKTDFEPMYFLADVFKAVGDDEYEYYYYAEQQEKSNGKFSFTIPEGGEYLIRLTAVDDDYYGYSDYCTVKVENIGPADRRLAVCIGEEKELVFDRSEPVSIELRSDEYYWYYSSGEVSIDGTRIKAVAPGRVFLDVRYRTDSGDIGEAEIIVDVTDPVYTEIEDYVLARDYIYPSLSGVSEYSSITLASDDETVCAVRGRSYEVVGPGKCRLTITVDGKTFTDKVTAYAPKLSEEIVFLKKKKSLQLKVTGLPEGLKATYRSADKKVASVSSSGKIKAKGLGNTYITVDCGDRISFICSVNVTDGGTGVKAAKQAYSWIGSSYSQDRRMQEGYFDCSSLAWRSYKVVGKALAGAESYAPTAADLAQKLEAEGCAIAYEQVSADELRPGDLIFYSSSSNGRYKNIDHVAVYYGAYYSDYYGIGNLGLIVHATSPYVNAAYYEYYIPYRIVMICRPK